MKKLIAIVAAFAVVVGMGMTSLAAGGAESPSANVNVEATAEGYDVVLKDATLDSEQKDALKDIVTDGSNAQVVDVTIKDADGNVVSDVSGIKVAFTFDGKDITNVYVWDDAKGVWDENAATLDGNNVTFAHLTPVLFILKDTTTSNSTSGSTGKGSAQTGYNELIYIVSGVALAAGAVFFFSTANKSKKQSAVEVM